LASEAEATVGDAPVPDDKDAAKCQATIAKERSKLLGKAMKELMKCQKDADAAKADAAAFTGAGVDASCSVLTFSDLVTKAESKISGKCADPNGIGVCSPLPDCVTDSAVATAQLIGRCTYPARRCSGPNTRVVRVSVNTPETLGGVDLEIDYIPLIADPNSVTPLSEGFAGYSDADDVLGLTYAFAPALDPGSEDLFDVEFFDCTECSTETLADIPCSVEAVGELAEEVEGVTCTLMPLCQGGRYGVTGSRVIKVSIDTPEKLGGVTLTLNYPENVADPSSVAALSDGFAGDGDDSKVLTLSYTFSPALNPGSENLFDVEFLECTSSKICSETITQECTIDADCPGSETCVDPLLGMSCEVEAVGEYAEEVEGVTCTLAVAP
jgi:hypothetical protein